ncbi:MAG: beta-ketoacyl-[acyl-carrier-protein] synthase family protein, partial [Actinomycetota bacterium]|nr:beta-ketoacyl-[acyl-carrier-protein] synthase family protein [Actinomycetota bacterium]
MPVERRVVVTGLGVVSPLGNDPDQLFRRLLAGESAIREIAHFDTTSCPCTIGASVEGFDARDFISDRDTLRNVRMMDPVHVWALCAASGALVDADLEAQLLDGGSRALDRSRVGVSIGTGLSGRRFIEHVIRAAFADRAEWGDLSAEQLFRRAGDFIVQLNPVEFLQQCPSLASSYVAMRYRATGPSLTLVSLCAAGAQAIGEGAASVARGDADIIVAGGADSMLNLVDLTAFCALGAVTGRSAAGATASRPFDLTRDGCVVGEGAAMVVLEDLGHALQRGARIYAELRGYGTTNDAYKVSAPPEDGEGAFLAMRRALDRAGLDASEIDHVNTHGTSTPLNDRIETHALKRLLGQHAYEVTAISTKSMIGHLIAAAGAIEAVVTVKTLEQQRVHPTLNLSTPDPNCDLDYVPGEARSDAGIRVALSNSFAIGGVNATLVFERWA